MHVDVDYKTSAYIGKHSCSVCGAEFKLSEGLMVSVVQGVEKATIFVCQKCLEKHKPYQTVEFDIAKERYPKLGPR
jgi:hypothetical protein